MKKSFLALTLLMSLFVSAQQVIVNEMFEKNNEAIGFTYNSISDKMLVQKGEQATPSRSERLKNLYSYDKKGKKEVIFENEEVKEFYYLTENAFRVDAYHLNKGYSKSYKIYANGKFAPSESSKNGLLFLNEKYEFNFINQKNDMSEFDLENDDLSIFRRDVQTKEEKTIKLEKLNTDRLLGDDLYVQDAGNRGIIKRKVLNYVISPLEDNTIQILTKAISKDRRKIITYTTVYNMDGKIIKDTAFEAMISNHYFSPAIGYFNGMGINYGYNIFLNGYYEDTDNGDVYFYGLLTDEVDAVVNNKSCGYYVMKFDKDGKKAWEFIKENNDKEFGANLGARFKYCAIDERYGKLDFSVSIDHNAYNSHEFIDKKTGKSTDVKVMRPKDDGVSYEMTSMYTLDLIKAEYSKKSLKDKFFDLEGIYQLEYNPAFANYVKSINNKKDTHLRTIKAKDGIWLIETDNKNYYKISYFNE